MANIMTTSSGSEKPKRRFELRMSKKVAELTQVVHMLFTRNHEKEVEMEALKEAYEFEICEVISDAKRRIAKLEQQLEDMLKQQTGDTERIRKLLEGDFQSKEQEWRTKLEEKEKHLQEERTECQNLRDLFIRAQVDIENLRQGVTDQITSHTEEVTKRDREIERLKQQTKTLEQTLKERGQESSDVIKELEKTKDNVERELRHVHGMLEESHKTRDQLLTRNKQLEVDTKALRRDFNRKVADMVNGHKGHSNGTTPSQNEELERLRREIQRYRLELSNRDVNFNHMFTDKQPIHVDRSGPGGALKLPTSHSADTVQPAMNGNSGRHMASTKKEKTLSSGPIICFQEKDKAPERQRAMSTPSIHLDACDSRFPSISSSPDIKPRPVDTKPRLFDTRPRPLEAKPHPFDAKAQQTNSDNRMAKPRPLPKEMLFGK